MGSPYPTSLPIMVEYTMPFWRQYSRREIPSLLASSRKKSSAVFSATVYSQSARFSSGSAALETADHWFSPSAMRIRA